MKSKIIAFVTVGAIAVTSLSAPARADDNFVKFLVGTAVIGAFIAASNDSNPRVVVKTGNHRHRGVRVVVGGGRNPNVCLKRKWTNHGWRRVYGPNCMRKIGWHRHNKSGWHRH